MISIITVDSTRSLPIGTEYDFTLIFFYIIGGFLFLISNALVAAKLATSGAQAGGIYIWLRSVLGLLPPNQVNVNNVTTYHSLLISGVIIICIPPVLTQHKT